MRNAYAVSDVRVAERALMARVPDGALMQRAAAGLASACARLLGQVYGSRVVVLAGAGDNGGDALFAGARLARRGAIVTAVPADRGLHEAGAAALRGSGGRLAEATGQAAGEAIAAADLIIDGILGIGGRGGLREPAATLAALTARAAGAGALVVATDLPSGVDADTGVVAGAAIRADVTVTFGAVKPGLLADPGAGYGGTVELIDIGLGPYLTGPPAAAALQAADVAALLPRPAPESDKYRRGVLGVLAGSQRYTGAAVLSVGGAIRGGAGMVRLVSARAAADVVRQHWPATVLASPVPVLVDADGLTVLSSNKDLLAGRDAAATVITPHAGELARLLNCARDEIEARRLDSVRRAAAELGVTVLLKGSTTVIATPEAGEPALVNPTGTPWLATAGSGDVLSGLAGALLAQGVLPARWAAAAAAFVHGLAGRLAARDAPIGAADVLAAIPEAIRRVSDGEP